MYYEKKVVFSLLLSLAVLAGCTRPLDTPSSEMPSIESTETPVSSVASSSQPLVQESSSSSEPRPFREVGQWVTLSEEPELEEVRRMLAEKTDKPISYLYITDSQGYPVSNVMCYLEDESFADYSMPCGLVPIPWIREGAPATNPMKIALANPNMDDTQPLQWVEAEMDLTGQRAYHLVWEGESPDEYAQKAENGVSVSLKYADGTPAAGLSAYLGFMIPSHLRTEEDEGGNPQIGVEIPAGQIPNPVVGAYGFRGILDVYRYADDEGKLHFTADVKGGDQRLYYRMDLEEHALFGRVFSHSNFHPYMEVPVFDENGDQRHSLEVVLSREEESKASESALSSSAVPSSSSAPVQPESTLIITFVDSNGVPAAFQEVIYEFGEELPVASLGKTDANGKIVFHPQAVGRYMFFLEYDGHDRRVDHSNGTNMGPIVQDCVVTELGHTEEYTYVIKVYPITENTPTENCIVFTILSQEGKPLKDIRLFYKEATGSKNDYVDMNWLHMGLTNEDGQFFFQYPKAGDYLFMHEHPDRPDRRCHISYTLTSDKGRYDITNIVGPENMY